MARYKARHSGESRNPVVYKIHSRLGGNDNNNSFWPVAAGWNGAYFALFFIKNDYNQSADDRIFASLRWHEPDQVKRVNLGPVYTMLAVLLCPKLRQSRRAERSLVIPNERQATPSGAVWDTTRRAWPVLRPSFVVSRLSSATTLRFFRLAGAQNRLKQDGQHSVNRP